MLLLKHHITWTKTSYAHKYWINGKLRTFKYSKVKAHTYLLPEIHWKPHIPYITLAVIKSPKYGHIWLTGLDFIYIIFHFARFPAHNGIFTRLGGNNEKKKSPIYTFILHIHSYNYNQTFHLTAFPITLKKVQRKNLTSVLRSQPHHQQYIAAHRWEPAALAALPGNRTAGALPHPLQRKTTRCAQTHFHEQFKLTSIWGLFTQSLWPTGLRMHQFLAMRQLDHITLYMQANVTTGHNILIKVTPLWEPSFLPLAAGHLISIYILSVHSMRILVSWYTCIFGRGTAIVIILL